MSLKTFVPHPATEDEWIDPQQVVGAGISMCKMVQFYDEKPVKNGSREHRERAVSERIKYQKEYGFARTIDPKEIPDWYQPWIKYDNAMWSLPPCETKAEALDALNVYVNINQSNPK